MLKQNRFSKTFAAALLTFATLLSPRAGEAAVSPIGLGVIPPVQLPSSEFSITGLRVSALWGKHRDLYGLDFGVLGNVTEQTFFGIGVSGVMNYTRGTTTALGLQGAGIANVNTNKTRIYGLQLAAILNYNSATSDVIGLQLAAVNLSEFTNIYGLQAGVYNRANEVYGIQIGLVNVATNLHGIQIGLLNFNHKGLFYVAPILNVGF